GGDALGALRLRVGDRGLHEEKLAPFVNQRAAEPEEPLDLLHRAGHRGGADPRLLHHLAQRRGVGSLAALDVALGKSPVAVAVADEQVARLPIHDAEHDAAGRRLVSRAGTARARRLRARAAGAALRDARATGLATAAPAPAHARSSISCRCARPSMNCRTTGSVVFRISSTVPTWRT